MGTLNATQCTLSAVHEFFDSLPRFEDADSQESCEVTKICTTITVTDHDWTSILYELHVRSIGASSQEARAVKRWSLEEIPEPDRSQILAQTSCMMEALENLGYDLGED